MRLQVSKAAAVPRILHCRPAIPRPALVVAFSRPELVRPPTCISSVCLA
jgi:hypothetical protein